MNSQHLKPSWRMAALGEMVDEISKRVENPSESGFDRFVGLEHFDTGDLKIRKWGSTSDLISAMKLFSKGDTLFARRNAYLRRASMADFDGVCSGDAIVLREKPGKLVEGFLPLLLNTDYFWEYALANAAGSMSKRVNVKTLLKYEFPLPPLDEQKRIAEILWAADESAEAGSLVNTNLERMLQVKINRFAHQEAERGNEHFLADCIDPDRPITYGILKPGLNFEGGIPVVKVRDYPNGTILLDELLHTTPEIEKEYKRSRLIKGDILISIRGTVGRVAEVPAELDGANITQDTARLAIKNDLSHRYIRKILESNYVQRQITAKITGLAVQGINIGELRKIKVPIPELKIQNEFAAECIAFRNAQECCNRNITSLKTLLKKYFETKANGDGANV